MNFKSIDLHQTNSFSNIFLDYLSDEEKLRPFYHLRPQLSSFGALIPQKGKTFSDAHRQVLVQALKDQYHRIDPAPIAEIESLGQANTFTVTTGHQLNLFTGPLYFIYKIISTIKLAQELKEAYPDYDFVPVYWMATEDHDFEEINHFYLFNKKFQWETEQKGAVGRFHLEGLSTIFEQISDALPRFEAAYLNSDNLSEATIKLVNSLFQEDGLVIIDADRPALKALLSEVIWDDLSQSSARDKVLSASEALEQMGYKTQIFPREINLFYLDDQLRSRFIAKENGFGIQDQDVTFSKNQVQEMLAQYPERFSPNVVLRPLYQEIILPNLAYIGGPSELSYWLQLKGVFDHYQVVFPILMPRNFALYVNKSNCKKLNKLGLEAAELFESEANMKDKWIKSHAEQEIELKEEGKALNEVFVKLVNKAKIVDQSLEGFIKAEENKALKSLANIEKRLKKAEENKQQNEIKQLTSLKEKLFPEGKLQERHDNLLNFFINDPDFIKKLMAHLQPFSFKMNVFLDE